MKLPYQQIDITASLAEFDMWITPSLSEIRDSEMFSTSLRRTVEVLEILGNATNEFLSPVDPEEVATTFLSRLADDTPEVAARKLQALASLLYLVTGKSDNNVKCQLPVYLRNEIGWSRFPRLVRTNSTATIREDDLPRVLEAERYMETIANITDTQQRKHLLREFVRFILNDKASLDQFASIGRAYYALKNSGEPGSEKSLLAPLILFQIRGSVTASGGHEPENILRKRLEEWGLERDVDFNSADALESGAEANRSKAIKTRAYDFILPYRTNGWEQRIFIQCQFYAGDSGSVSHKNVDQTDASRQTVLDSKPQARFIEYVDGAGYAASLNGDLKKLLQKDTTASFFQIRSAPIRLRRELQHIGFLTPLEVEHAILRTDGSRENVTGVLIREGYEPSEIERCISRCLERGILAVSDDVLTISAGRRSVARRYFLLDVIASRGRPGAKKPKNNEDKVVVVPGYGPGHGLRLEELLPLTLELAPTLQTDWHDRQAFLGDLGWLRSQGFAMIW